MEITGVIIVTKIFLLMNSTLAKEKDCKKLKIVNFKDQWAAQGEIKSEITWKASLTNFFKLTTSGGTLRSGEFSNNICKCVLSNLAGKSYADFDNVVADPYSNTMR